MSIVAKTIELLKLSYSEDITTAFNAECAIFENFGSMTPQEHEEYCKQAKTCAEEMELNPSAEAYKAQTLYENGMSYL